MNPIIPCDKNNVNNCISVDSEMDTIQRCPHDEENPYALISRALIRDASLSPECRWLIIYLLSMKNGWKINIQQIINHLKGMMGRDKIYGVINEAIEAGYMKREVILKGNIKQQTKYLVSETPKFKKISRHPEFQDPENRDTESRDTENPHIKNKHRYKNKHIEEEHTSPPIPPQSDESAKADKPAKAGDKEVDKTPKPKKEKPDFSNKVREFGQKLIEILIQHDEDYIPPKNLAPFLEQVDFMLRLDKRDPQKVLDVLRWALSDPFWNPKVYKPNTAKYLREKFLQWKRELEKKPVENPNKVDRRLRDKEGNTSDDWKDNLF